MSCLSEKRGTQLHHWFSFTERSRWALPLIDWHFIIFEMGMIRGMKGSNKSLKSSPKDSYWNETLELWRSDGKWEIVNEFEMVWFKVERFNWSWFFWKMKLGMRTGGLWNYKVIIPLSLGSMGWELSQGLMIARYKSRILPPIYNFQQKGMGSNNRLWLFLPGI